MTTSRTAPWLAAVFGWAALAPAAVADDPCLLPCPTPCPPAVPCPPAACPVPCPPTRTITVPPAKVVVHVPPPEVSVKERPRSLFHRDRGRGCDTCAAERAPTMASIITPMPAAAFQSFGATGFNFGAVAAAPAPTFTLAPQAVQTVTTRVVEEETGVLEGLRAVHSAEVRVASIVAARARQDAELRATLAALDRARGVMAATLSAGECKEPDGGTTKSLVAVVKAAADTTNSLREQIDRVDQRLQLIESQVRELKAAKKTINP